LFESKINIALFFGGRSAEHEVSLLSARSIFQALNQDKYNIFPIAISKNGYFRSLAVSKKILFGEDKRVPEVERTNVLPEGILNLLENKIDLVFPVLHGPFGEDGKIQGFLDVLNIKYVGCNLRASAVGMDKAYMKQIFAYNGIPQSKFEILKKMDYSQQKRSNFFNEFAKNLGLPFFIKPANMGSSIGISRVNDLQSFARAVNEAFEFDKKLILESNVEGRELESAVLGSEKDIKVSAAGEIISTHDFYDYQAKYEDQSTELIIPAKLSPAAKAKIRNLSVQAFRAVGAEGISRLDFFVNEEQDQILVNEINTMPGFTKFSMYPLLFEESGISYSELLDNLIELALKKDK